MAQNVPEEKLFEYYSDFPPELQMMIVDEMHMDDRCRFTRCSKSSNRKAKSSKNYMHTLIIHSEYEEEIQVNVYGCYILEYHNKPEEKFMKYLNVRHQELWRIPFCPTTDVISLAIETFKNMLKFYQRTIKVLEINGEYICDMLRDTNFEIDCLFRLESLRIYDDLDINQFLSKTRKPLHELIKFKGSPINDLASYPQIYDCDLTLDISKLKLTYEQFIRLSARNILIHIGELTPEDIARFIRSWQNGTLPDNFEKCHWRLKYSTFDVPKLCRLLNIPTDGDTFPKETLIKNYENPSWIATLTLPYETEHLFVNVLDFSIPYDYY